MAKLAVAAQPALRLNVADTLMQPIRALAAGTAGGRTPEGTGSARPA